LLEVDAIVTETFLAYLNYCKKNKNKNLVQKAVFNLLCQVVSAGIQRVSGSRVSQRQAYSRLGCGYGSSIATASSNTGG